MRGAAPRDIPVIARERHPSEVAEAVGAVPRAAPSAPALARGGNARQDDPCCGLRAREPRRRPAPRRHGPNDPGDRGQRAIRAFWRSAPRPRLPGEGRRGRKEGLRRRAAPSLRDHPRYLPARRRRAPRCCARSRTMPSRRRFRSSSSRPTRACSRQPSGPMPEVLSKPFDVDELLSRVARAVG